MLAQSSPQRRVVFGIGSNLGDRVQFVRSGINTLVQRLGKCNARVSRLYETTPVGGPAQGDYVNAALSVTSSLSPDELLHHAQQVEALFGRVRTVRFGPRTLDIDVLWIEGESVDKPYLQVPHPRLMQRGFALRPLLDVEPEATDPHTGQLLANTAEKSLFDPTNLRRISDYVTVDTP